MQEAFSKKKSKCIFLLTLFLCTFSISCTQKSFLCWNEKRTRAMAFSYDDTLRTVTVRDIHSYSTLDASKEPLQSHMSGGTHRLQIDQDSITLEVIQYTASAKTQLPSGKFIDSNTAIEDESEWLKQRRYHAVYPTVRKYIFDRQLSKLSYSSAPLPKPRSAIEQRYIYDQKMEDYYLQKTRDLTNEEFALLFPPHEKEYRDLYPHCEEESHSLKRVVRSILRSLSFP